MKLAIQTFWHVRACPICARPISDVHAQTPRATSCILAPCIMLMQSPCVICRLPIERFKLDYPYTPSNMNELLLAFAANFCRFERQVASDRANGGHSSYRACAPVSIRGGWMLGQLTQPTRFMAASVRRSGP